MPKYQRQRRYQSARSSSSATPSAGGSTATSPAKTSTSATPQTGASNLAAIRSRSAVAGRPAQQKRYRYARQPWWRRNLVAIASVVAVLAVVVGFVWFAQAQNKVAAVDVGSPAPKSVLTALSGVSAKTAAAVGNGGLQNSFQKTPLSTPPLTAKGLPVVVYIGAEYCPYCAADRWGTIIALNRFGSFENLKLMKSSSSDSFANTSTFSFKGATYTSKYFVFDATETQDRNQSPLDTPDAQAMHSLSAFDVPPYTNSAGGIPFLSYGDQWITTGSPYDPTVLQGLTWQQIAAQLNNPSSPVTKSIVGTANMQTAAICKLTNNQPANVCSAPYIQTLEAALPSH